MKRIYVVEDLCNGCRLCESFCASLEEGVFSSHGGRIRVTTVPSKRCSIPIVDCNGECIRSIHEDGRPTCVALCPTGALIYAELERAVQARLEYEAARQKHSLFKIIAPWKWPFPWLRPNEQRARSAEGEVM
ncbi:MAG: hypothetical protein EA384_12520 [Spirochaetaceae bacterium]|nr:MAG: hypothetical protein EA384_12520 [Spirochaetaceae bacterium]